MRYRVRLDGTAPAAPATEHPWGVAMSSAFLYLAIVAIWAVFLVPAWLRRPHGQQHDDGQAAGGERAADDTVRDDARGSAAAAGAESAGSGGGAGADAGPVHAGGGAPRAARPAGGEPRPAPRWHEPDPPRWREPVPAGPADSHDRARMLKARRRILLTLVTLTAAAAAAAQGRFAGWWICIPPAGMLVLYLLLLREVAMADAEIARGRLAAARARAAMRSMTAPAAAQPGGTAPVAATAAPGAAEHRSATIIDISHRVGDQLYDQYADAAARAVGD